MQKENYELLIEILNENKNLSKLFDILDEINLKDYYISSGIIAQSIWNKLSNLPLEHGISDIDIVFYDKNHLNKSYEKEIKTMIINKIFNTSLWLDIKNQAGVHLWYKEKFGYSIEQYSSLENAINTFPTTATAVGIRKNNNSNWEIYAPYGIEDLFNMKVKANPIQITEEIYLNKMKKWKKKWKNLNFLTWNEKPLEIKNPKIIKIYK